jgi:serine protease Do
MQRARRSGSITLFRVLLLFSAAGLAVLLPPPGLSCPDAQAQEAQPAAFRRSEATDPEQRAELYRTLQDQARILEAQAAVVKTVAKLVGPTVVHVEAEVPASSTASNSTRRLQEEGSGVIVKLGGKFFVVTNRHVVRGTRPERIKLTLHDGRQIHPNRVWSDPETDVGVLAVEAQDLVPAEVGDSDRMEIGDFVLAVGSPFGLSHSVTFGIVSAKGRRDLKLPHGAVRFQDFIQTDAAINPGNSGGPLINLRGEVIGINTAIASNSGGNEGIGFAIPANMIMFVTRQLIETGTVRRAFLGVNLDADFDPAKAATLGLPFPLGARVTSITQHAPADEAKVRVNDVILEFNRVRVEDDGHLINLVGMTEIGKTVPMVVLRSGKAVSLEIKVGDRGKF